MDRIMHEVQKKLIDKINNGERWKHKDWKSIDYVVIRNKKTYGKLKIRN